MFNEQKIIEKSKIGIYNSDSGPWIDGFTWDEENAFLPSDISTVLQRASFRKGMLPFAQPMTGSEFLAVIKPIYSELSDDACAAGRIEKDASDMVARRNASINQETYLG